MATLASVPMDKGFKGQLLGFLGGTGHIGAGLAYRFAVAGFHCAIGSRDAERALKAAADLSARAGGVQVSGDRNEVVASEADVVFLALPYEGLGQVLGVLGQALAGKVVVCPIVALKRHRGWFLPGNPNGISIAEHVGSLTAARVVAAFHHIPADLLLAEGPIECDVLMAGDDQEAKHQLRQLVIEVKGMRLLDAGPLKVALALEAMTSALINLNKQYKWQSFLKVVTS